jgi:hypothetical protein
MKKTGKISSILVLFFVLLGFSSCENETLDNAKSESIVYQDSNISVNSSVNINLINMAETQSETYAKQITSFLNISNREYDELKWEDYQIVNLKGENVRSISKKVVLHEDTFLLSFVINNEILKSPFITRVKADRTIEYYFLDINEALSVKNNQVSIIPVEFSKDNSMVLRLKSIESGCGQAVMNCINDAYSNHGWTSVFAWVAGLYVPATAVGIAAACTAKNCLNDCGCPIVDGKPQR